MSNQRKKCEEANHTCDKNQYKEARFWEKVKLTIHLIYCRACRKYSAKNAKLTEIINTTKIATLDKTAKDTINATFQKELAKHHQN